MIFLSQYYKWDNSYLIIFYFPTSTEGYFELSFKTKATENQEKHAKRQFTNYITIACVHTEVTRTY